MRFCIPSASGSAAGLAPAFFQHAYSIRMEFDTGGIQADYIISIISHISVYVNTI